MVDVGIVFRIINIIIGCMMVVGGVFVVFGGGFPSFIRGIFVLIFGLMTILFEFRLPGKITQYASFMFSFLGRGLFYIFIGCIVLDYYTVGIAFGAIIVIVGIVYCILEFFSSRVSVVAPSNMQKDTFFESAGAATGHSSGVGVNDRYDANPYANTATNFGPPPGGQPYQPQQAYTGGVGTGAV
ncbi:hypothetical protein BZG36_04520 [Bifiguratus adelaidae]|uniref:Golgi apparatus membrane protein tvp15 n=1 Tax=Bifiguratus adelaidae TaxID=1938954 RepID=A0A261XXA2_9FUNG|nr:hypothetical protein BZG36_04520 [Bifiguratus adelaidae]